MGKSPKSPDSTTIETTSMDPTSSSTNAEPSTSPPNPTSFPVAPSTPPPTFPRDANQSTQSVNTTHSQPPPPYTRPNPLSARLPGRSNLASQLNTANTANHPRSGPLSRFPFGKDTDFTLRVVTLGVAVIGIVLFVACLTQQDAVYSDGVGGAIDIFGFSTVSRPHPSFLISSTSLRSSCYTQHHPTESHANTPQQLGASAFISIIFLISDICLLHQKKYPMHPALPLTFDLMAWCAVLSMAVINCMVSGYSENCTYYGESESCNAAVNFVIHGERAAIAMMFFAV